MGLPWASFTLSLSEVKLWILREMRFLAARGLAKWKPGSRTVPTYRPKNTRTTASLGWTVKRPAPRRREARREGKRCQR
jgi:hypothetical protein